MATKGKSICRHAACGALIAAPGYCDKHKKESVGWNRSHGDKSSNQRGYGAQWRKIREVVMRRDMGLCQCDECKETGRIAPAQEVDHIIPKAQGGTDDLSNLHAINVDCHKAKTIKERKLTI